MTFNLRKRTRVTYYEPEEPNFDEYVYCEQCADFVYEYCAVHGPLLVVPDNKADCKEITWRALHLPNGLNLHHIILLDAGLGVFSTLTLPRGVRFGPYCGQRTQNADSLYCWQIFDSNNKRLHVIDAADTSRSNWMRYVNCARHSKEQNLVAFQFRGQLYYRTIKIIPRYTELLVFYGSEFANALHIDLKKYNSAKYYKEIIRTPEKALLKNQDDCMQEDYLTEEHFHFIDKENEDENSQKPMKSTKYISCIKTDDSFQKIKENIKTNDTTQAKYECDICQKRFINKKNLKKHILKHLNTRKYSCEHCHYRTNEKFRFNKHIGYHTNSLRLSCDKCPFKTNYVNSLKRHSLSHAKLQLRPKSCQLCDFKTVSRTAFCTHMFKHRGVNIYKCEKCSYSTYSKRNLSRHTLRQGH